MIGKILIQALFLLLVKSDLVKYTFVIEEWVVDFMRPTISGLNDSGILPWQHPASRQQPFHIPEEQRKHALLINGMYPGPLIDVYENDTVEVTVINKMMSEATTIHWHGVHVPGTPYMDGARSVTQGPILPGESFTYKFTAWPAGSHWYHSHMDAVQASKGIKGPFVIKRRDDPYKSMYDEDIVVSVSDEWREPSVCLKLEGAMAGNPGTFLTKIQVCADVRHVTFNGQYGDGSKAYPYPTIEVESGKCYRMRYIFMGVNTENLIITMAGHQMTLIAKDGGELEPLKVKSFNMHLGERYDVIVCAHQEPGNYLISARYDYACTLTEGNFIPPGFSAVPACEFYAFIKYTSHHELPANQRGSPFKAPPLGSGGGLNSKEVQGVEYDLTQFKSYQYAKPLNPEPEPEEPDVRYVINLGLRGPTYSDPTDRPMTKGHYYMDLDGPKGGKMRPWHPPTSPLYMSKGKCGVDDIPIFDVPEEAVTVEVVVNNLSPAAHVLHLHGMDFKVINFANYEWCNLNRTDCFLRPHWLQVGGCPKEDVAVGDPNHPNLVGGLYWGCKYNEKKHKGTQNLLNPIFQDSVQVWQRSWLVLRFKAINPGYWFFHCHMEQHIALGMQVVFNIRPSEQPLAPVEMPLSGSRDCDLPGSELFMKNKGKK